MCHSKRKRHSAINLCPISRFQIDELKDAIKSMKVILETASPASTAPNVSSLANVMVEARIAAAANPQQGHSQEVPTFDLQKLDMDQFEHYWSRGVPVVISNVQSKLQGIWGPSYFIERYGAQEVYVYDCETNSPQPSTVAAFFRTFGKPRVSGQIFKLKVCTVVCSPFTRLFTHFFLGLASAGPLQYRVPGAL
jgi:hypothetical protein